MAAIKLAVARLRPMLEAKLPKPLAWQDVEPALCLIDTVQELRDAAEDPEAFLTRLMEEAVGPAAFKLAVARLREVAAGLGLLL